MAAVKIKDDAWGFVDKAGEFVIELRFQDAWGPGFEKGLAQVRFEDGKWGYIDKSGKTVWKSN